MAKFDQSVDINATVDAVWSILTDTGQWQIWFPDVESVGNPSAFQTGGTFQWQSGGKTGTGRLLRVTPNQILEVDMELGGHQATHTFQVNHHGGLFGGKGSQLHYTLEYQTAGGIVGELVAGGNPVDLLKAKNKVEKLKELVERTAGHR
jgi:uncharacterized protein YndB with AHSA1/START domain